MSNIKNADTTNERTVGITRSGTDSPCLWESGGGSTNTGTAQIITDSEGYPKRPIFIATHGDRSCGDHALLPVQEGDHIVTVNRRRDKVAISVERIVSIERDTATVVPETEPICIDAINAAISKANDYHCRDAYYI